ncbi:MAG: flagellar hook-length control protein FliK [Gammaproteobacteria bacterium]|nr:flagellar hook-length control protein FliK [Gammaproteobacteria bacterium]
MRIELPNLPGAASRPSSNVGAIARTWAIGQLLNVSVGTRVDPNTVRITVDGQPMLAQTTVDLPSGTQLTARVASAGVQPQLTLIPPSQPDNPDTTVVNNSLGRALPQQAPLAEVLPRLLGALTTPNGAAVLPTAVTDKLTKLANSVPSLASLAQPAALATAVSQSGLHLESKLASVVLTIPAQTSQTSPTATPPAPTLQAPLPTGDLKWQLLGLREAVINAPGLAQAPPTSTPTSTPTSIPTLPTQAPEVAIATSMVVPAHQGEDADSRPSTAGPGSSGGSTQIADGLLDDVNAGLARISTHQLQSANAAQHNTLLGYFELPVQTSRGVETMTLEVKDEHRERTSGSPQSMTVLVEVPVGELGKLRARIALSGERIAITTWSETPELRRLIASNIGQLDAALLAQGFDVAPSVMREINAPRAVHAGYQPLIDTQV